MLEIGSIVDGKYKILNKIGQGGMSVVYLAMNERANKPWAIKEVRKDGTSNYEVVKQNLIAETDILKRLNHAHLPSIIDVIDREDTFLIVMDYIEGRPLSDALKKEGAQPQEKVIEWAKQICDVLGYLHSRKPPIIYRDMKPSNVMLKPDGNIMIIDFGTAREYKTASIADTTCLGTQGYAAPEQFGGQGQTDARTDIYCLGATLYHLVTGHNPCLPPYEMYPIRQWNPALSSGLEQIIIKCTQRNPNDRYQSCAELMYALEHYNELDLEYRQVQNRKWKTFLATSVLTVVTLAGSLGFRFAETSTTSKNYDSYMRNAENTEDTDKKIQFYKNAISLNPRGSEAYLGLLNAFRNNTESDGESSNFTKEEADTITKILGDTGQNNRDNESYLQGDREGYDTFCYELGMAYYFDYEKLGNPSLSKNWFKTASEEDSTLDTNKKKRSEILAKIAEYDTELRSGGSNKSGDSTVTFRTYWDDMMNLVQGKNLVEQDNPKMAVRIYKNIVYQIYNYTQRFKSAGVSESEITQELDEIEVRLDSDLIITNESDRQEIEEEKDKLLYQLEQARSTVTATYADSDINRSKTKKSAGGGN